MLWILNFEAGTFLLPPLRLADLKTFLAIPSTRRRNVVPRILLIIEKLRSMQLVVPVSIGHLYYTQEGLTKTGTGTRDYLSKAFNWEISHWRQLCADSLARPHFLEEVVRRLPIDLDFCDASGMGAGGGLWIYPNGMGANFVWCVQWPADISSDMVSWTNPTRGITNSDLELAELVLQYYCFPFVCSRPTWHTPFTGRNNTPAVS